MLKLLLSKVPLNTTLKDELHTERCYIHAQKGQIQQFSPSLKADTPDPVLCCRFGSNEKEKMLFN